MLRAVRQLSKVSKPLLVAQTRNITSMKGAIKPMPATVSFSAPVMLVAVVSAGGYVGAKCSETGAWLLKEFSLFEYEDEDDEDDD